MKERIIGAIVLVLFVVLVVPVFLDGPTNSGEIISENVPLPGQAGHANQTIVLDRDRTEPVPAASIKNPEPQTQPAVTRKEEPPATKPEPVVQKPAESKPAESKPAPEKAPVASTTGMWAVQLGSFGDQNNADKMAAELRKQGFAAFLSKVSTGSNELHRVRIGPQKDREGAEAMAARLEKAGHKGQVVPHP